MPVGLVVAGPSRLDLKPPDGALRSGLPRSYGTGCSEVSALSGPSLKQRDTPLVCGVRFLASRPAFLDQQVADGSTPTLYWTRLGRRSPVIGTQRNEQGAA